MTDLKCLTSISKQILVNTSRCVNFFIGGLAQLGERLICIQEVAGSIPVSSTILTISYSQLNRLKYNTNETY